MQVEKQIDAKSTKSSGTDPYYNKKEVLSETLFDPSHEPSVQIPGRSISIQLVNKVSEQDCQFWVGLSKKGKGKIEDLLAAANVEALMQNAATNGYLSNGPILISNTEKGFAEYYYLLESPALGLGNEFVLMITKTIYSIGAHKVGFYFSPAIINSEAFKSLLPLTLKHVILGSVCNSFYLLIGEHGLDTILNITLKLKSELMSQKINLSVFH